MLISLCDYSIKLYFKLYLNFIVLLFKFMLFIKKKNLKKLYLFHMLLISREQQTRLAAVQMSPPLVADTMTSTQHLASKCWMADKNDSL